jgi:hypothetical protein
MSTSDNVRALEQVIVNTGAKIKALEHININTITKVVVNNHTIEFSSASLVLFKQACRLQRETYQESLEVYESQMYDIQQALIN